MKSSSVARGYAVVAMLLISDGIPIAGRETTNDV
jgi:hypothetical protein